jgi:3-oxoacyl-[acyl-carrier protein] reductase
MTDSPTPSHADPVRGRVALVTGASGGIGKAISHRLAEQGADLFLTYGRHREGCEEVADHARQLGRRAVTVPGDLADPATPARLVKQATDQLGGPDILVANAGIAIQKPWDAVALDEWNITLAVNLTAPFLLAQHALPGMVERRFGRILFISSVAAFNGGLVGAHYAASKAGLHGLTHHLAGRVAEHGITVNALAPALIGDTAMLPVKPETDQFPVQIPIGRLGRPTEVADMAITMLRNDYLTNKVITLDGGLLPR